MGSSGKMGSSGILRFLKGYYYWAGYVVWANFHYHSVVPATIGSSESSAGTIDSPSWALNNIVGYPRFCLTFKLTQYGTFK